MTDADALLAHCLDHPDDHSAKLVWLDAFQERHGETPWVQATREFLAKCGERRKYEKQPVGQLVAFNEKITLHSRRALPGWREWLGPGDEWTDTTRLAGSWIRAGLLPGKWLLLCPSLLLSIKAGDEFRWCRKGGTVDALKVERLPELIGSPFIHRARLTFAAGFLARAEFATWEAADALLPAILADQPFVEAGIRGAIRVASGTATPCAYLITERCGPAFEIAEGRRFVGPAGEYRRYDFPDAEPRARRALSAALRKRALIPAAASPVPSA